MAICFLLSLMLSRGYRSCINDLRGSFADGVERLMQFSQLLTPAPARNIAEGVIGHIDAEMSADNVGDAFRLDLLLTACLFPGFL